MSVTSGFFNSINHDRRYDATQMSAIFDGIINDGVFASVGTCFAVKANEGMTVNVGAGRAWFNHTWTYNDVPLPITAQPSELILDRIDAVVLEVNNSESVRENTIKIIKGTPSSDPIRPALIDTDMIHQHILAYLYITADTKEITQSKITNMVGTTLTPFVTGILDVVSLNELLGQWESELDEFVKKEENDFSIWYSSMVQILADKASEIDEWTDEQKKDFLEWYSTIQNFLDENVAVKLKDEIDKKANKDDLEKIQLFSVSAEPPEDTNGLWIDTSAGGISKYYNAEKEEWTAVKSVWG